jgi:hypothetical protein
MAMAERRAELSTPDIQQQLLAAAKAMEQDGVSTWITRDGVRVGVIAPMVAVRVRRRGDAEPADSG